MTVWQWDPTLYAGSAQHYLKGRMPYPPGVVQTLREILELDGTGRLLDVGSGPGALTFPLAGLFAETVAVDADEEMVSAGRQKAESLGLKSISWKQLRAEELSVELGSFRLVTFAQSFHWMDQQQVATIVAGLLDQGGTCVYLEATTERGTGAIPRTALHFPQPPWAEIDALAGRYLGPERRAGQGVRTPERFDTEDESFIAAGFEQVQKVVVPNGVTRVRTVDEVVASVFSLSYSAPHLFGDQLPAFESELRELLTEKAARGGLFAEEVGDVTLTFWRPKTPSAPVPDPAPVKRPRKRAAAKKPKP